MRAFMKAAAGAVFAGSLLVTAGAAPASAQNNNDQDGLINVFIGEVNVVRNVDIGVAAQVAAQLCGIKVGPVAVLGTAVDRSGDTETVCELQQGDVTLQQN